MAIEIWQKRRIKAEKNFVDPNLLTILAVLVTIVATIFLVPVLIFRPLVLAISKRIAGNKGDAEEVKQLRLRVSALEQQVNDMCGRVGQIEDSSHFAHKVLEDVVKKTTQEVPRSGT